MVLNISFLVSYQRINKKFGDLNTELIQLKTLLYQCNLKYADMNKPNIENIVNQTTGETIQSKSSRITDNYINALEKSNIKTQVEFFTDSGLELY
jgi:hypothetical protein